MKTVEDKAKPYGIRVSVAANDPFAALVGADWSKDHWFASQTERDSTLLEMSREHEYSRHGDKPTLIYSRISRTSNG